MIKIISIISLILVLSVGYKLPTFCIEDESVTVELMVFSGSENPHWKLNNKQIDLLCLRIMKLRFNSNECDSLKMGYNGFLINGNFRIFDNFEIEQYLLTTSSLHLSV